MAYYGRKPNGIGKGWPLTMRQHQMLEGRCQGRSLAEAAAYLSIEYSTANNLARRAMKALNVVNMNQACYELGKYEAERKAKQSIANHKRYAKATLQELEAQIAADRKVVLAGENAPGTEQRTGNPKDRNADRLSASFSAG